MTAKQGKGTAMNGQRWQKGDYFVRRYRGNGGDLPVGRIDSMRDTHVVVFDLVRSRIVVRQWASLEKRHIRVTRAQAEEVLRASDRTEAAVQLCRSLFVAPAAQDDVLKADDMPCRLPGDGAAVFSSFCSLAHRDRWRVARLILKEMERALPVDP